MRRVVPLLTVLLLTACSGQTPAAKHTPAPSGTQAPEPTVPAAPAEPVPSVPPARPTPTPTVVDAQPHPTPTVPGTVVPAVRYVFPVQPATAASYGREHHDYPATDIFADCGTRVVAVTGGVIEEVSRRDGWDPQVNEGATRGGKSISVIGDDGVRYYGSHFSRLAPSVGPGTRVEAGDRLGRVGRTGSARDTPCHLHFGISPPRGPGDWEIRRGVLYPWPYLDSWRDGGQRSPVRAVRRWGRNHPG